jgi:hypothetical protein
MWASDDQTLGVLNAELSGTGKGKALPQAGRLLLTAWLVRLGVFCKPSNSLFIEWRGIK